jgi:hypothetical protein
MESITTIYKTGIAKQIDVHTGICVYGMLVSVLI